MIRLTRRYRFAAAHRLHSARLSQADNKTLYGKCNNAHGHGHDYVLEVTLRGPVEERTGRVAGLGTLDRLVGTRVLAGLHQKNLNKQVEEFAEAVPTTENLALAIGERLSRAWRSAFPGNWPVLEKVKLQETRRNIFETRMDPDEKEEEH